MALRRHDYCHHVVVSSCISACMQIVVMAEQNKQLLRAAAAVANEQAALAEQLAALQRIHSAIVVENSALCDALPELHNRLQVLRTLSTVPG